MLQIFIPHARGAALDPLWRLGLGDLTDNAASCSVSDVLEAGPDGNPGAVYSWHDPATGKLGYHPAEQHWAPCKPDRTYNRAAGAFWLGKRDFGSVAPESLARGKQLLSAGVTLADGNVWQVPIAVRLPKRIELDAFGDPIPRVQSRYESFYARASEYFTLIRGYRRGEEITIPGAYSFAVQALAFNYRFTRDVADFLDLFTEENLIHVIGATFEVNELDIAAAQKKKAG